MDINCAQPLNVTPVKIEPAEKKELRDVLKTDGDSVQMGTDGKKTDYTGIMSTMAGGIGGAAGGFFVGRQGGLALGILSELAIPSGNISGFLMRLGWSTLLGGIVGAASGAVCGAVLVKTLVDLARGKGPLVKEEANPGVARAFKPEDNYDSFKGLDLKIAHIGTFTENPHTDIRKETVKTVDIAPQAEANARMTIGALNKPNFKPDVSSLKMNPDAIAEHTVVESEQFRGIALGKRIKIGHAGKKSHETVKYETDFTFKAELPYGAQATMKTRMHLKADQSESSEEKSGFMK